MPQTAKTPFWVGYLVPFGGFFRQGHLQIRGDLPSRDRISGRWRSFFGDLVLFSGFFGKVPLQGRLLAGLRDGVFGFFVYLHLENKTKTILK